MRDPFSPNTHWSSLLYLNEFSFIHFHTVLRKWSISMLFFLILLYQDINADKKEVMNILLVLFNGY